MKQEKSASATSSGILYIVLRYQASPHDRVVELSSLSVCDALKPKAAELHREGGTIVY